MVAKKVEKAVPVIDAVIPVDEAALVFAENARKGRIIVQNINKPLILTGVGCVLLGAGLGVGAYYLLKKRLHDKMEVEFDGRMEEEIASMRKFYLRPRQNAFGTPEEAVQALIPNEEESAAEKLKVVAIHTAEGYASATESDFSKVSDLGIRVGTSSDGKVADPRLGANSKVRYDKPTDAEDIPVTAAPEKPFVISHEEYTAQKPADDEEPIAHNVFNDPSVIEGWDAEKEEALRRPELPYIISHDEWLENSYEHEQNAITYYAGDDMLADEREVMIEDIEAMVGTANMQRFGHGSRDSSIVYIRNERVEIDFEVVLNTSTFAEEVMGLQHSDTPRYRRGRKDDDE